MDACHHGSIKEIHCHKPNTNQIMQLKSKEKEKLIQQIS
jgi:hypothetical protein